MLYLNMYAAIQIKGGSEEGGWYYEAGIPLASVPIPSEARRGCGSPCGSCYDAEQGIEGAAYCQIEAQEYEPQGTTTETSHLAPVASYDLDGEMKRLTELFSHCSDSFRFLVEDHYAVPYPETRPTYE